MASKKKNAKKQSSICEITLVGGPSDGKVMRMDSTRLPPRFRLALPEWANYYRVGDSYTYEWKDIPWVPVPFLDYF